MTENKEHSAVTKYQDNITTVKIAEAVNKGWENNRFQLLALGTGVGKTYIAIKAIANEDENAHIITVSVRAKIDEGAWEESVESFNETMGTHLTISTQTFTKMMNKKHQKALLDSIPEGKNTYLVFDEVQVLRNTTKKTPASNIEFAKRGVIKKILGLSALMRPNTPFEMCTALVLNGDYPNKTQFLNAHMVRQDKYFNPIYEGPNDLNNRELFDELTKAVTVHVDGSSIMPEEERRYVVVEESDYEYPSPAFNTEKHPFGDTEARTTRGHYVQALNYYKKGWIESEMALRVVLLEILARDPQRKFSLYKILNSHFKKENSKPVLIGYEFNAQLDAIVEVCKQAGVTYQFINGTDKDQSIPDKNKHAVIVNYKSGGTGIELKFAPTTIFYMPTDKVSDLIQFRGRNIRRFMEDEIIHYYMTTKDKRDYDMWVRALEKKEVDYNKWIKSVTNDELKRFL